MKIIAQNKKAHHDYFILDKFEAGIILKGTEIKSIRKGKVNIKDSYARIRNEEIFLVNMHISKFEQGNIFNHDETRSRKLLLNKKEIIKISRKTKEDSLSIVPLKVYLDRGLCKIEIALAKGKKNYDKRQTLKEKDSKRRVEKALKNY